MVSPDMQNMPPNHGMNQGPPNMGPGGAPMMGDGPPHPPGNYYNNFFNQQDGMKMEGMTQDGENYLHNNLTPVTSGIFF